jgi:phage-related protein
MESGLWEVRTDLPTRRTARVLICVRDQRLIALHGFIKKTRTTPDDDLALARRRKKELDQ